MISSFMEFWHSRLGRFFKVYTLVCLIGLTMSVSIGDALILDAMAQVCSVREPCTGGFTCEAGICVPIGGGGGGGNVPEMPTAFLPLFLLVSAGSFYMVRRRVLKSRI